MDLSGWVLYTFIAALALAASVAHYRWREPDGSGRVVLGVTRGAALALIVLLLFDPVLPAGGGTDRPVVALVDASLSMSLVGEEGASRWDVARELVATVSADRVQLFGTDEARSVSELGAVAPTATRSRLAPALRTVLETGAARVVVITDGAVEDAAEARRLAGESGIPIEVRAVDVGAVANLSLEEVDAAPWLEVGEPSVVRFTVGRSGQAGPSPPDSVTVTLTREGRELARARVPVPPLGRATSGELRFRSESAADDPVRLDVVIDGGGAVPDDDVRSVYVRIAEEPAGVALVSLRPDQEPRFLLPVLERALGLPVRGWIGLSDDRFLGIGTGWEAGVATSSAAVRRAVEQAALVVVHGVDANAPEWARASITEAARVLVLPSDPPPPLPVSAGTLREGEWYLTPDVPSSPVAPLLAGIASAEVPPLVGLRPMALPEGYWTPLVARLGRRGEGYPVAVVGVPGGRRVAIALGEGYWRWAFASREGRDVYDRFWSAVTGWLMEHRGGMETEAIRPVSRVVDRGALVRWIAPMTADSITITIDGRPARDGGPGPAPPISGAEGAWEPVVDTTVMVDGARAITGSLPPGHYRYVARTGAGDAFGGELTVESYSPEFAAAPTRLDDVERGTGTGPGVGDRRRLRTLPLPYLLIVGLVCLEWVLRRRWGLR